MKDASGHQFEDSALQTDFFGFNILKLNIFEDSDLSLQSLSCQNSAPSPRVFFLRAIVGRAEQTPQV